MILIKEFLEQVANNPHHIAAATESKQMTYTRMDELSNYLAAQILKSNCKKGHIGLFFEQSIDMIVAVLSVLKAGKTYIPLSDHYPDFRIEYILEDSEAELIITNSINLEKVRRVVAGKAINIINIDGITDEERFDYPEVINEMAYILYTSGSTGKPKGVIQTRNNILHFAKQYAKNLKIDIGTRMTLFSSFCHDAAVIDIFSGILHGATLYPKDIRKEHAFQNIAKWLIEEKINIWHSVPTLYRYFTAALSGEEQFNDLKYIVLGGENVIQHDVESLKKFFRKSTLVNLYGQSESSYNSSQFISGNSEPNVRINIGEVVDETEIFVVDEHNEEVMPLGIGEIVVASHHIASGYWNRTEETTRAFDFSNAWGPLYWTGDLGRLEIDGTITWLGRKDFQVKIRGHRVELGDIESCIMEIENVRDAVAVANEGENGEYELIAYYTTTCPIDKQAIIKHTGNRLPDYMIPYLQELSEIPLTESGKVDRKKLLVIGKELHRQQQYEAPRNEIEGLLAKIWVDILGVHQVGIHDNFFELGGHSLRATTLSGRIQKDLLADIGVRDIFEMPTIAKLAEKIRQIQGKQYEILRPLEKRDLYLASSAQKRIYITQTMNKNSTFYNMPLVLELIGNVDRDRIEKTLGAIILKHEAFRTTFHMEGDELFQKIHDTLEINLEIKEVDNKKKAEEVIINWIKPFKLDQTPLMRAGLFKEGERYLLVLDMHHIISDGTSMNILAKDFIKAYNEGELNVESVQYKEYAEWEREQKKTRKWDLQKDYWQKEFTGEIPVLEIPMDGVRGKLDDEGRTFQFEIEEEIVSNIKNSIKLLGGTLYMGLMAGYSILLSRYSRQEDIIVGCPIAGRRHAQMEKVVGMFVNILAIRTQPKGDKKIEEYLIEMKQKLLTSYENQEYSYDELVEELQVHRDLNRNPLFDVVLALQNTEIEEGQLPNLQIKPYELDRKKAKFDLALVVEENKSKLICEVTYRSKIYNEETIKRMMRHYKKILEEIGEKKDLFIKQINMLSEEEKNQILNEFNNTKVEYDRAKTIVQLFEEQALKIPEKVAVVYEDKSLTYKELNQKANQIAHYLRKKGVEKGQLVAIMIDRSLDLLIGILGILKANAAYLPIDINLPEKRVSYILEDSGANLLLTKEAISNQFSYQTLFQRVQPADPARSKIYRTTERPQIKDLNGLSFPDRTLVDYEKYHQYIGVGLVKNNITIQASRGCPYHCAFCHKIWPKNHVVRSAENIFEEIKRYYDIGIIRFTFLDDIFNLDVKNSTKFFELVIKNNLDIQMLFPNGLRGDILTKDYIDLMVEAGLMQCALAIETASPRLQKMIGKNVHIDKLRENLEYIINHHPHVILDCFFMIGFPTETEEEALKTLEFVKTLKWLHFPTLSILKIYSNTDMARLAIENGVKLELIERTIDLGYHEIPATLPFPEKFVREIQSDYFNNYFLKKERLLHVLKMQKKVLTKDEIIQKYNSYMPTKINSFSDLLDFAKISSSEVTENDLLIDDTYVVPEFNTKIKKYFPENKSSKDAIRILLLDLSQYFTKEGESDVVEQLTEAPIGLLYLLTHLNQEFNSKVNGKIAKSKIDFNSYEELRYLIEEFKPDLIGIRTLTFYQKFFHKVVSLIREWGYTGCIIGGGPYATSSYETVLQDSNIDLVILGEGELTLSELVQKMLENEKKLPSESQLKEIKGLAFVEKKINNIGNQVVVLDRISETLAVQSTENLELMTNTNDVAYVIYTSGSTGKPKGVMIEHGSLMNYILWANSRYIKRDKEVFACHTTPSFDLTVTSLFTPFIGGHAIKIVGEKVDNLQIMKEICRDKDVTVIKMTPSHLKMMNLLEMGMTNLQTIIVGGEQLETEVAKSIQLKCGKQTGIYNEYGPTEATVGCIEYQYQQDEEIGNSIPIGKPINNTRVYILDAYGNLQPAGVPGELCIAGDGLARGYLNRPDWISEKFIENPYKPGERMYKTGDLAKWLSYGNIEFLGRIDHQIKIRGYRIELGEIEAELKSLPGVKEAVVLVTDNDTDNKYLTAYLVLDNIELQSVKDKLKDNLPDYMIPASYVVIHEIPLTINGKVDRQALLNIEDKKDKGNKILPRNIIEHTIADIWKDALNLEEVYINDDFFGLGGNSINIILVANEIQEAFAIDISVPDLISHTTVAELAEYISVFDNSTSQFKHVFKLNRSKSKRNIFIVHGADGDIFYYRHLAKLLEDEYSVYGIQPRGIDGRDSFPDSFFQMLHDYIKEIRMIQKESPYILGGYCIGGYLSYDLANIFEIQGDRVAALLQLDEEAFVTKANSRSLFVYNKILRGIDLWRKLTGKDKMYTIQKFMNLIPKAKPITKERQLEILKTRATTQRYFCRDLPLNSYYSYLGYVSCPTLVIKGEDNNNPLFKKELWQKMVRGSLEFYEVPGNHDTVMFPPYVNRFAEIIKEYLYKQLND